MFKNDIDKNDIDNIMVGTVIAVKGGHEKEEEVRMRVESIGGRTVRSFFELMPDVTVSQNILQSAQSITMYKDIMSDFGLDKVAEKYPRQITSAQRTKAALAKAVMRQPDQVFMLDYTESYDSGDNAEMIDLLSGCSKKYGLKVILFVNTDAADAGKMYVGEPSYGLISDPVPLENCNCN